MPLLVKALGWRLIKLKLLGFYTKSKFYQIPEEMYAFAEVVFIRITSAKPINLPCNFNRIKLQLYCVYVFWQIVGGKPDHQENSRSEAGQ